MKRSILLFVGLSSLAIAPVWGQESGTSDHGKLVDSDGTRVHIFGLKAKQPLQLIKDIRSIHPSRPLGACMADLRGPLGYPDALVRYYPVGNDNFGGVMIGVVDLQDSARVSYRAKPELGTRPSGSVAGHSDTFDAGFAAPCRFPWLCGRACGQ
ncbi:MAG: hypothetical protein ACE5HT_01295 [Gemmatimonadales bacterium]